MQRRLRARPWPTPAAASTAILAGAAAILAGCRSTAAPPRPAIVTAAAWGSEPEPIPEARRHRPRRITIHHAGVLWKEGDDPFVKIRALQRWGQREKGWPDVPYHFLIAPDGRTFEGRPLAFAGETNTEYDTRGHALVQLWGNFEVQRPSRAQLESAVRLCAWLCRTLDLPAESIRGHRDWSRQTSCPGRHLYALLEDGSFVAAVAARLRGAEKGATIPGARR